MQENPRIIAVGAGLAGFSEECRTGSIAGRWSLLARGKCRLETLAGRSRGEELLALDDEEIKRELPRVGRRNPPPGMFRAVAGIPEQVRPLSEDLFPAGDEMRIPSVSSALARGVNAASRSHDVLWGRSFPVWPVGGVTRILDISMCDEEEISCKLPDNPYAELSSKW